MPSSAAWGDYPSWLRAFRRPVAARPRLIWVDRLLLEHILGADVVSHHEEAYYGADSVLLDQQWEGRLSLSGLWLEFGVFKGATLRTTAFHLGLLGHGGQVLYGFDSFQGIPDAWHTFEAGSFSTHGRLPEDLPPNAQVVEGWFNETLRPFLAGLRAAGGGRDEAAAYRAGAGAAAALRGRPPVVQWLHLDCDVHTSHSYVLSALAEADLLAKGTVIVFDDLLNFADFEQHGLLSLYEFQRATGWSFEVLAAPWRVEWAWLGSTEWTPHRWWIARMRSVSVVLTEKVPAPDA